jgi:hypothetical protein
MIEVDLLIENEPYSDHELGHQTQGVMYWQLMAVEIPMYDEVSDEHDILEILYC